MLTGQGTAKGGSFQTQTTSNQTSNLTSMSAPQPKTSMTIDTSSGSGNHEGPFATPSPSLLPSLMNAGNGTVGGPGQGSGGAMGSGVSAVSTVSNISPSVGVGVGVGVGLGRGMPGAGAMASISEDERIARMEVEMFRHLNRAETLRAEIRRAKQNQMALHQGHRITQTDPTPYRRLDPRVQGMYFGHQANGNFQSDFNNSMNGGMMAGPRGSNSTFMPPRSLSSMVGGMEQQQHWSNTGPKQTSSLSHMSFEEKSQNAMYGLRIGQNPDLKQGMNHLMMAFQGAVQQRQQQKIKRQRQKGKNPCPYCEKVFQNNSRLERHIRSHTGERPFMCSLCGDRFKQKCHLNVHIKRHREFKCPICNVQFPQKKALIEHMTSHMDK